MLDNLILLQAEGEAAPGGGGYQMLIFIGLFFVIMYFFFMRPQIKKQKQAQKYREALKKGDSIVTIGGIHGKVVDISDTTVLISTESGKLRLEKSAVSSDKTVSEQTVAQRK